MTPLILMLAAFQQPVPVAVPAPAPADARPVPMRIVGRVEPVGDDLRRQWPGTRFETAFRGTAILFRVGAGEVILSVTTDDAPPVRMVRPAPGWYRIGGLRAGDHRVRVEVVSESQSGPTAFGGFHADQGTRALRVAAPARAIEFIGDSHTVGYGNLSPMRSCTAAQIWETTDTSAGIAGLLGRKYGADVRVHAISGRGVVRNYDGFAADTLPVAYPYTLFDRRTRAADRGWSPQLIVIALGTNDFTTPLKSGEPWKDRAALHAAYEERYVTFVRDLRARHPKAFFVLWATDLANGEIDAEVRKVADRLRAGGERRLAYVPVTGLAMTGCDYHPSAADDRVIADALAGVVAKNRVWK